MRDIAKFPSHLDVPKFYGELKYTEKNQNSLFDLF